MRPQWRVLRAAVDEGSNDLFIVGDSHQRIYGRRSSLSKVGINIRGRSRKLRINYRTTRQILRWSLVVLGEGSYDDLDEGVESQDIAGYHSYLDGPDPTCQGFPSKAAMVAAMVEQVQHWVANGIDESDIGVAARTKGSFAAAEEALRAAGVVCPLARQGVADLRGGSHRHHAQDEGPRVSMHGRDRRWRPTRCHIRSR